jgi:leader peptidase (prepilin peptidase)/N-methyltransferase
MSLPILWTAYTILIVISVYDARHKIVPDMLVFILGVLSILWLFVTHDLSYFGTLHGILDLAAGPLFFIPFFLLWLLSRGEWMGLGDGKLVVGLGWLFGIVEGASGIILGFWIAAGLSIIVMLLRKFAPKSLPFLTMRTEVPFAPFLVLGCFIAYYFSLDVLSLKALLSLW